VNPASVAIRRTAAFSPCPGRIVPASATLARPVAVPLQSSVQEASFQETLATFHDSVRWALARIRERPAYAQLVQKTP